MVLHLSGDRCILSKCHQLDTPPRLPFTQLAPACKIEQALFNFLAVQGCTVPKSCSEMLSRLCVLSRSSLAALSAVMLPCLLLFGTNGTQPQTILACMRVHNPWDARMIYMLY